MSNKKNTDAPMGYNRRQLKMKKAIFAIGLILSISCIYAFSTTNKSIAQSENDVTVSISEIKTISVVKIVGSAVNHSFSGKYDTEENYIRIYNKDGKEVASGNAKINYDRKGNKKNYNAHLNETYYFNV